MAKAVFRPGELIPLDQKVVIEDPTTDPDLAHLRPEEEAVVEEEPEEYSGPTAEDLRREAEAFKEQWETEKAEMIQAAKDEAEAVRKDGEDAILQAAQQKAQEAEELKNQARLEAEGIIAGAKEEALELEKELRKNIDADKKETEDAARQAGREQGFAEGSAEVDRLIQRTHLVLERAQNKRAEILSETEQEIIDLVLLISRKVIKVISENQRNVIISNVVEALRKVRTKGNVIIRVNIADVKLTTEHTTDFIQLLEGVKSVQVVEDSSVDSGGCIIETDFGEIDARIASQLAELETKILEVSPIKSRIKSEPAAGNGLNGLAHNGASGSRPLPGSAVSNGTARAAAATRVMAAAAETAAAQSAAGHEGNGPAALP